MYLDNDIQFPALTFIPGINSAHIIIGCQYANELRGTMKYDGIVHFESLFCDDLLATATICEFCWAP